MKPGRNELIILFVAFALGFMVWAITENVWPGYGATAFVVYGVIAFFAITIQAEKR